MPTHDTTKRSLRTAIGLFAMPAHRTGAAGVARVNRRNRHPGQSRLVADKLPQLSKGPIAVSRSLRWPFSPRPLANVGQLFNPYRSLRAFGLGNKPLADAVVRVLLKPALPARQLAQPPFGRLRTDRLQRRPAVGVPLPLAISLLACVRLTVAVGCQIDDAQVYPEHPFHLLLIRLRHIADGQQVERTLMVDQVTLAFSEQQELLLMLAQAVGDVLPPFNRPDRHRLLVGVPGQVAVVKGDSSVWTKRALHVSVERISICYFRNTANEDLRPKPERVLDVMVRDLLKGDTAKLTRLPRDSTNRITRGVRFRQCCQQCRVLLSSRIQFDLRSKFHIV